MQFLRRPLLLVAMVLALASLLAFTACGDDDENGNGNGAATPGATEPANGDNGDNGDDNGNGASGTLTLVSRNILFDKNELTAPAGEITIVHDHQDAGIPHNVAVHEGTDAEGELIDKTEIEPGPVEQRLTLNLEAGTYFYVCEVHPTTMTGILTVE